MRIFPQGNMIFEALFVDLSSLLSNKEAFNALKDIF